MYKILIYLFAIFFGSVLTMQAQFDPNSPIPLDPKVKVGKLPNGLTYYIRQNKKPENKAKLRLIVNAGSTLEREDQRGLAHFLEHMAFNGTKNFKKNELVSFLQSIGVSFGPNLNAFTTFDETVYGFSIPTQKKEMIDKGLLILSDWGSGMTLEQEDIDKERGVILEESRASNEAELRMIFNYYPKIYPGSPYADRFPIGKKEVIETFNRKALVDFYETWYRPDLMAVIVVGDIDVNDIEAKIKSQFSALKAKRPPIQRPNLSIPDNRETIVAIETDKEAQKTSVQLSYKKPATRINTYADLRQVMLVQFFTGMLNARLSEISQSPNPPFIEARSGLSPLVRTKSAFSVAAETNPQGLNRAISALLIEKERVRRFGFTPPELERQNKRYSAFLEAFYQERDKMGSLSFVQKYKNNFLTNIPFTDLGFDYQFGKTVTPTFTLEEINALAKNMFTEDNRMIIITGTDVENIKYPTQAEILKLLKDAETAAVKPYTENVASEPLVKELPATAKIVDEKNDNKSGITTWTLSNGVKIILKPTDFKADEITMNAYSPGGLSLVDDKKFKSTLLFNQILNESGLGTFSKTELNKRLAGKRVSISLSVSDLFETVGGNSSQQDFETLLQLTYLGFTGMKFEQAVLDSLISKEKMTIPTLMANPQNYFSEEIRKVLTQNHPRSLNPYSLELVDQIKLEDIREIYQDRFGDASDFTFVFVGNFENEAVKPHIIKYLGNLPTLNRKENWRDSGIRPPAGKIEKIIKKGLVDKSVVDILFTGNTVYNDDESRSLTALGELLNIKLLEILREEKGGVYTPDAGGFMVKIPDGEFIFEIIFSCSPANVDSLIQAALAEIKKIQSGQIDEQDITKIKQARLVNVRQNMKENSYWMSVISGNVTQGNKILSLEEVEVRINSINKGNLQKAAQKYLTPDNMKQFVLMPESYKK